MNSFCILSAKFFLKIKKIKNKNGEIWTSEGYLIEELLARNKLGSEQTENEEVDFSIFSSQELGVDNSGVEGNEFIN